MVASMSLSLLSHARVVKFTDRLTGLRHAGGSKGASMVQVVRQHHLCPAWLHALGGQPAKLYFFALFTQKKSIEVAFDRYMLAELLQYAMSWLHVMPHVDSAPNYMAVNRVLLQTICQRCHS